MTDISERALGEAIPSLTDRASEPRTLEEVSKACWPLRRRTLWPSTAKQTPHLRARHTHAQAVKVLRQTGSRWAALHRQLHSATERLASQPYGAGVVGEAGDDLFGLPGVDCTPGGAGALRIAVPASSEDAPVRELTLSPQQFGGTSAGSSDSGRHSDRSSSESSSTGSGVPAEDSLIKVPSVRYELVVPVHRRCPGCAASHGNGCRRHPKQPGRDGTNTARRGVDQQQQHHQGRGWLAGAVRVLVLPARLVGWGLLWGAWRLVGFRAEGTAEPRTGGSSGAAARGGQRHDGRGQRSITPQHRRGGPGASGGVRPSWFGSMDSFNQAACSHPREGDEGVLTRTGTAASRSDSCSIELTPGPLLA